MKDKNFLGTTFFHCFYFRSNSSFLRDKVALNFILLTYTLILTARVCAKEPVIAHGEVQCRNHEKVYGNLCEVVCGDGYQVQGMPSVGCDTNGNWGTMPVCKGILCIT